MTVPFDEGMLTSEAPPESAARPRPAMKSTRAEKLESEALIDDLYDGRPLVIWDRRDEAWATWVLDTLEANGVPASGVPAGPDVPAWLLAPAGLSGLRDGAEIRVVSSESFVLQPWGGTGSHVFALTRPLRGLLPDGATVVPLYDGDDEAAARALLRAVGSDRRDVVVPETRPTVFDLSGRLTDDGPSIVDTLGTTPLVASLREMLDDERTKLPLAIAITAPWGCGKSSVMEQLAHALTSPADGEKATRRWHVVRFPAWKYEGGEQVWAGLTKAIFDDPQKPMSRRERLWFRAKVYRRRKGWTTIVLSAIAFVLSLGLALWALQSLSHGVKWLGSILAAFGGAEAVLGLLRDRFKQAIDRKAAKGAADERLGFVAGAEQEVAAVMTVLAGGKRRDRVLVLVDDLDRCRPNRVAETVDAINQIFNSGTGHGPRPCVFVLGMDPEVVTAALEVAYQEIIGHLAAVGSPRADRFGEQFLAKVVQLSVAVPRPEEHGLQEMLALQLELTPEQRARLQTLPGSPSDEDVLRYRHLLGNGTISLRDPVDVAAEAALLVETVPEDKRAAFDEAVRLKRGQFLNADSPAVADAEFAMLRLLPANPRDVKRFDNAFRLQLHVANLTPHVVVSFSRDELKAYARWVALRLAHPRLSAQLDLDGTLLERVDAYARAGGTDPTAAAAGDAGLVTGSAPDLLNDEPLLSSLPERTLLRVR